jgi:hypothetical protein
MVSGIGFGGEPFGRGAWGGALSASLSLVSALAVSENVIQLTFSVPVYFSGLLDFQDASNRLKYTISPVVGSVGIDGTAAKAVAAASVSLAGVSGVVTGLNVYVTTDRPMTPNPAQYLITCQNLWSADLSQQIVPGGNSAPFAGLYRVIAPPQLQTKSQRGDIANPQDYDAVTSGITPNPTQIQLGCFAIDSTGDYAVETGLTGYKKRILRRLLSRPGAFLHLGNRYGAGIRQYGKTLASAQNRSRMIAAAEQQVSLEPETEQVSVRSSLDQQNPGKSYLVILAKTRSGKVLRVLTPVTTSN